MVIAKRSSKNQLTLPKAVVEQVGAADDDDVACDNGRIVLTPLHPGGAEAVRRRLAELGISEADVAEAVTWARQPCIGPALHRRPAELVGGRGDQQTTLVSPPQFRSHQTRTPVRLGGVA